MRKYYYYIISSIVLLTSCKRTTPVEMLFGTWEVAKIVENSHNVTDQYVDNTTAYLQLSQSGIYQIGLMDSTSDKNWTAYPESNQLVLLQGGLIDDIKKWEVRAADNQLQLIYPSRALTVTLNRIKELPELAFKTSKDLVGKWVVEKVSINGSNSTSNYAFPDRWIILSENGRFYNGENDEDQNTGFWKTNESLTKIEFRADKKEDSPALSFHVANETIWYQKEKSVNERHSVKIYFKKEDS